ncbi:MAG TPA: C4-dicarboxylate transporter DctA [Kineosporiaceae bacterium]|nr:C4-dicarboxylate transporter DctA [Kineosporiaceae bacterium]
METTAHSTTPPGPAAPAARRPFYKHLYVWVLVSIVLGVLVGLAWPKQAADMQWLATLFINLVKVVIAPLIFTTVVVGIAGMGNLAKAGGIALRTIGYFMAMTIIALVIGLVAINVLQPGAGLHMTVSAAKAKATLGAAQTASEGGIQGFVLSLVPKSFASAFVDGQLIQVLLLAILVAVGISFMGRRGEPVVRALDAVSHVLFGVIRVIMYAAPIGAFGGMAFTVGKYGTQVLGNLAQLMGTFYLTCVLFIAVVLGVVSRLAGFSVFKVIRLIKDELLIVLGTSSSETVLPRLLAKLEASGADKSVVGLTVPTGYSFNLDGTCIYLTMGAIFIAQATGRHIPLTTQIGLLLFMLLTSKGAAGVTGAGLVTLAASLTAFGDTIPAVGIALIVGIDRFMSEARALTNLIGNAVATLVIARWQGALDTERLQEVLDRPSLIDVDALMNPEAEQHLHLPQDRPEELAGVPATA